MSAGNHSDDDRRFILRWRIGFLVFYSLLGPFLVGIAVAITGSRDPVKIETVAKE